MKRATRLAYLFVAVGFFAQRARADAITINEYSALGVAPANLIQSIPVASGCANPLPATAVCGPDPFGPITTGDGNFTISNASDTVTNTLGLFQFMNVFVKVTDDTGFNGIITLDVNQTYAFSGIATSYTAFDFMSGSFGGPPAAGLPNANTSVQATLAVDSSVILPILSANAGQADAAAFTRGFGYASFGTPPLAGVTFDALAQFNFLSGNQIAGDFISLPYGESDAPEPGTGALLLTGGLALAAYKRRAG